MVEAVLAMLHVKSNKTIEVVIVEAEVVIVEAEVVIVEAEVVTVEAEVVTVAHVENEVTQKVNDADQAPIVQRVHHDQSDRATTKVAEIVVQGVLPVDTMVATVVQVHHVDAKLSN